MRPFLTMFLPAVLFAAAGSAFAQESAEGDWVSLFDGSTLDGWEGRSDLWSVQDGAITGQTTPEIKIDKNSFLIYRNGMLDNFELKLQYRIVAGNSGIQYRSFELPGREFGIGGYQADFEAGKTYSGILYGEAFRGILAQRGQKTELHRSDDGKFEVKVTGSVGDTNEIQAAIKNEDWNDYHIIADGYHLQHFINGMQTVDVTDLDTRERRPVGLLAFQVHVGPPMIVQFRDIKLKRLPAKKKIVLLAGTRSHGYGAHEHHAGCLLLAKALNESGLPVEATVVQGGWPEDDSILDDADSIVIYADGGGRHPFNDHLPRLDQLAKRGIGMAFLHYGVEVPIGPSGEAFLNYSGGYFEPHWSVNPHWTADFSELPDHPTTNGVRPFAINDEWYYHMRFREDGDGVTPILTDLPPADSLSRPDGAHSGNKFVRAAILERKETQAVAWTRQRPDAGRGFGFTGGHFHWNWGHNDFRKLVLNSIAWTAHLDVPADGVPSEELTVEDLMENQDFPVPDNFNPERIQSMIEQWNKR